MLCDCVMVRKVMARCRAMMCDAGGRSHRDAMTYDADVTM
jgi:hypothetical protein